MEDIVMRRALVPAVATALAGAALSLTTATGALAHGDTLKVEITGHDFGRVRTTVTWENDNDPVDERVAATVNAVSADGSGSLGPWKLVRDPASATGYTTAEALPPGRWRVTVEAGHPGLGRDEEEITVSPGTPASPTAGPGTVRPTAGEGTAVPASATPAESAGRDGKGRTTAAPASDDTAARSGTGGTATLLVAGGVVLAGAAGAGVVWRIRRAGARGDR
ncbi:hypothetical protein HW130_15000 [Streptomyces sp. PKU-EA00015]|uniref:hypothetical protein n=1 Tax=Streptomyces sp. PKU-EA00015 TaxID=2748326 RepID=UPI0015A2A744|nr:hypothetical protein [Streptomyces sp. PKU-EA00015]NWF27556.1 hypothetical protein [Streptomyces sp. PKU-EA00015]